MSKLTLISHTLCPFVQRAAISLAEKDIEFERKDIDLANKPEWFLKISPLGKVPLLIVSEDGKDDVVIFESNVILEYLEDTTKPKLHPTDALERARHRSWNEFGGAVMGLVWGLFMQTDSEKLDATVADIQSKFALLEAELAKNNAGVLFAGEKFTTVDAIYAPIFRYFDLLEAKTDLDIVGKFANITKWRDALRNRASVKAVVAANFLQLQQEFFAEKDSILSKQLS